MNAQRLPPPALGQLLRLRRPQQLTVANGGGAVGWTVPGPSRGTSSVPRTHVWIRPRDGRSRRVAVERGAVRALSFSPDGSELALATNAGIDAVISVYSLAETRTTTLGHVLGAVEELHWSRDGERLVGLVAEPGADSGVTLGAVRIGEVPDDDPRVIQPGLGVRRLAILERASGRLETLTATAATIWEFQPLLQGGAVGLFSADSTESGWYDAFLGILATDGAVRTIHQPAWQVASLALDSEEARLAFVEGWSSDRGVVAGEARVLDMQTGEVRPVPVDGVDVTAVAWRDESSLWFSAWRGFGCAYGWVSLEGDVHEIEHVDALLGSAYEAKVVASPDRFLAVRESPGEPPEVCERTPNGPWRRVTDFNKALRVHPPVSTRIDELSWQSPDGTEVSGLLVRPAADDASEAEVPLVVEIHGGPAFGWRSSYLTNAFTLASFGFAVLLPNPRGSTGYGQSFARANLGDPGGRELEDIVAGVDTCLAAGIGHKEGVGAFGESYGGFLTASALTRTNRFACGVVVSSHGNLISARHTSNSGRFFDRLLEEPPFGTCAARRYIEHSPVAHASRETPPTLVVHGAADRVAPPARAEELYRALVDVGVDAQLVIYPREGHGLRERAHQEDFWVRIAAFFHRHLDLVAA